MEQVHYGVIASIWVIITFNILNSQGLNRIFAYERYSKVMARRDKKDQINSHTDTQKEGKSVKIFDWIKAAKLIKEHHIRNASVGFDNSVDRTFTILKNGKPVKNNDDDMIPVFDETYPVLIDDDRREIMNCFIVKHNSDNILLSKSAKKMISLRWPKEALDIIDMPFHSKDIQESKYFQLLLTNPLLYFWPLLE